jgi:threonine aldolase
MKADE